MSRHRGAKQLRRFGLLGVISLLSLAYLLSVDRRPFRAAPSGHYDRLSSLIDVSILQSGKFMPLRSTADLFQLELTFVRLRYSLGGGHPSQTTNSLFPLFFKINVSGSRKEWYLTSQLGLIFKTPTYPEHDVSEIHCKIIVKVHRVFPSSRR